MSKFVSAIALLSAAGAANAAVFGVRSVDTNSLGSPIIVNGTLFQSTAAGNTNVGGPSGDAIEASAANQYLQYDSYVAIDSGPSLGGDPEVKNDGFQANPGDLASIGNPFAAAGQVAAVWFMDPQGARPTFDAPTNSLFANQNAAFIGRFSFRSTTGVPTGSLSLGANGVVVDIRDPGTIGAGPGSTDTLLVKFTSFDTTVQVGTDGGDNQPYATGLPYQLKAVAWSAGPVGSGSARWIGYDLYVVQVIPTPGTLALAGLGALVAGRRRRA